MQNRIKKYKVGIDSETYAISLVYEPAIEETLVALEKQNEVKVQLANEEKHLVYSAVLVPDKEIYRFDGENEYYVSFTKESIEKMSQDFMKEYRQREVTLDHEDIANEVCIVESWLKSDPYKDKSVALGLNENLPIGTWFAAMKVNNVEVWERIKKGELRGFSVESMISLEEFEKQNNDNMEINTNEEMFLDKIKNAFKEVLSSVSMMKKEEPNEIEPTNIELEEEPQPTVEAPTVAETPQDVNITPSEPSNESEPINSPQEGQNTVSEPITNESEPSNDTVEETPKTEEPKVDNHLEDLIASMREEIKALREMNEGLNERVKEMGKQPSAQPVNVNAKPSANGINGNAYQSWRSQLESYLIG